MLVQITSIVVVGLFVVYFLRKEKVKNDDYFGKQRKYTKKEKAILDYYKNIYNPIPKDKRLPNLKRDRFELEDVAFTATEMIYDNPIPTEENIAKINNGKLVKLLFTDKDGYVERMWVEIIERDNNIFKGILRNDAIDLDNLKEGKIIYFHCNNIYEVDNDN